MNRSDAPRVPLERVPPAAEPWPIDSANYYRGRRMEFWEQLDPCSDLMVRADTPSVIITMKELYRRSQDPSLYVICLVNDPFPTPPEPSAANDEDAASDD